VVEAGQAHHQADVEQRVVHAAVAVDGGHRRDLHVGPPGEVQQGQRVVDTGVGVDDDPQR
jgi:hypothetical protein